MLLFHGTQRKGEMISLNRHKISEFMSDFNIFTVNPKECEEGLKTKYSKL